MAAAPPVWSEQQLLSQLIMVGASFADPAASAEVVEEGAGGLVFFGQPPAGSGATLRNQLAALDEAAPFPPFLATDEEGGGIARLSDLVGPLPWPRQMVAQWSPAEVTEHLETVGAAMRALGMNMDLAPVLDTASSSNTIDEENLRSFSEVGSTAAVYGLAFLRGLWAGGIVGVVKHFPGLGHANGDTDVGPATDPPLADLVGDDLIPFQEAIANGVRVVMMSNVTEPDWGAAPATVNPAAYAYLRHMGFDGVILTDSLDAGAITATGMDGAQAVVKAIEAGADMAMITTPSDYPAALAGLEAAVSSGALSMNQVDWSVGRIVTVKDSVLYPGDLFQFAEDGLNGRTWNAYDASAQSGGPPITGDPSALIDPLDSHDHVYVRSDGSHLIEYVNSGSGVEPWRAWDLTEDAGGAPISGNPDVLFDPTHDLIHVYVEASNGHLIEYVDSGAHGRLWNAYDLSFAAEGGADITGTPRAIYDPHDSLIHVYVRGADGHLIEYVNSDSGGVQWHAWDLSVGAAGGGPVSGSPSALFDPADGHIHIYLPTASGDLTEYVNSDSGGVQWHAWDLTSAAAGGGPVSGSPSALFDPADGHIHVYARAATGALTEYVNSDSGGVQWHAWNLTSGAIGPNLGDNPSAVIAGGTIHVYGNVG